MNKLIRNTQKSSKYYGMEGLTVMDTDKAYYVIWFKLKDPKKMKPGEIYIKERPFMAGIILKKSVKIISKSELTIPNKDVAINMAQVEATHWTGGHFRPKILPKAWQKGEIKNFHKDIDQRLLIYK